MSGRQWHLTTNCRPNGSTQRRRPMTRLASCRRGRCRSARRRAFADQPTRLRRAKFSTRSAAAATLSAGLVIRVASSRARVRHCGARIGAQVRDQRFLGGGRKAPAGTHFQSFDPSSPEPLIGQRPEDQRRGVPRAGPRSWCPRRRGARTRGRRERPPRNSSRPPP